ncbi:DUF1295-domain-containing protein [Neoconidiobolus thromboides FSU 785]|nr:DUF1295-domain-containing protein [Neoconidiobolus thromboides FSU 785]
MRSDFKRFSKFWIAQMVWVYIVSLPCVLTNAKLYKNQSKFGNPLDIIGLTFFVVGLLVEIIADYQRFQFIFQRQSKLQVLNSGLWYYSRHPNYFGEIMLWWGIFIISLSSSPYFYIGILSPILTMFLLLKLSGIPKSEPQKDQLIQSKGTEEQKKEYENYLNRTSPLIMLPPSVYQNIPLDLKQKFFFELKSYRFNRDSEPLLNSQQGE